MPEEPLGGGGQPVVHGDADVPRGDGLEHVGDHGHEEYVPRPMAVYRVIRQWKELWMIQVTLENHFVFLTKNVNCRKYIG